MSNLNTRVISFDQSTTRLIRRLVDAQEEANRLKKKELELLRHNAGLVPAFSATLVSGDEDEGLDEKLQHEAGTDLAGLDQKMLEEAVAEGDDPDILATGEEVIVDKHTAKTHEGLAEVGWDADLSSRMGHPGGHYG